MRLFGPGPVFVYESLLAARRWQTYAARVALLAVLLLSLAVVWAAKVAPDPGPITLSKLARVGESFFYAIVGTQLALVLLAAPAYTAGAVCLDKARGTLAHMLVTGLSAAEIVLGKLGSRLLPVVGLVIATLPILALAVLLGGIDPLALFGAFLVTLGVAVAGCALALALSVWGNRPHEVLIGTYALWAVALLPLPAWYLLATGWPLGPAPAWMEYSNPFWLAFAPYIRPQSVELSDYLAFLGACCALVALLALPATLTLRWAAVREPRRKARRRRWLAFLAPSLDFNPVLWREWHRRPSRWLRAVWAVYAVLCAVATGLTLVMRGGAGRDMAAFVNAFQFAIGLLLVSVTAVTSLFEERVRGSLDMLLTTPLPTSSIVWGKWWGTYRSALLVAVLPAALGAFLAVRGNHAADVALLGLLIGLMLAYGAAVTSLGLALATWVPRFGVAVGLSVTAYVLLAAGSVLVLLAVGGRGDTLTGLASVSPWFGVGETTAYMGDYGGSRLENFGWKVGWIVVYALAAITLAVAVRQTFARCLGRVEGDARPRRYVRRVTPRAAAQR